MFLVGLKFKEKLFVLVDCGWVIDCYRLSLNFKFYKWVFGDDVEIEIYF